MQRALQTIRLIPGRDGKNAILSGWKDAIREHDEMVLKVEEQMNVTDHMKHLNIEQQRLYQVRAQAWLGVSGLQRDHGLAADVLRTLVPRTP